MKQSGTDLHANSGMVLVTERTRPIRRTGWRQVFWRVEPRRMQDYPATVSALAALAPEANAVVEDPGLAQAAGTWGRCFFSQIIGDS